MNIDFIAPENDGGQRESIEIDRDGGARICVLIFHMIEDNFGNKYNKGFSYFHP